MANSLWQMPPKTAVTDKCEGMVPSLKSLQLKQRYEKARDIKGGVDCWHVEKEMWGFLGREGLDILFVYSMSYLKINFKYILLLGINTFYPELLYLVTEAPLNLTSECPLWLFCDKQLIQRTLADLLHTISILNST